ncbi:unnamed protein product [Parnassius mnemosyne]|uniref:Uncharacterized protein n=1 Tax=Parnassius mnemosyne TaxID=213953 RepID=A0AAV1KRI4_9NEOP
MQLSRIRQLKKSEEKDKRQLKKSEELIEFIVHYGDKSVFPNLRISIQILLTIALSIAGCERSLARKVQS